MVYYIDTSIIKPVKNQRQENVPTHIFTPRTYQVEILDTALQRNTIVCLATETGKTFISVMLIRELAHQVRPRLNEGGKRSIVLINDASLVEYHAKVIRMHTDLIVGDYSDLEKFAKKSANWWQKQFRYKHVFVMPGEIFSHVLQNEYFTIPQTNLIVFDECHRAVNDHPYVKVMQFYHNCSGDSLPRILGLTASILAGQCTTPEALEQSLYNLEKCLDSTAETATDMVVTDLYVGAKPREIVIRCDKYEDQTGLVEQLGDLLESAIIFLEDCNVTYSDDDGEQDPRYIPRTVLQECQEILVVLGPWCCGRVAQAFIKQISKLEDNEVLTPQKQFLQMCHTQLRVISTMVERIYEKEVQTLEDFLTYMSPKVLELIEVLRDYKPDDNFMIIGGEDFDDGDLDSLAESDDSMDLSDDDDMDEFESSNKDGKGKSKHSGVNNNVQYVAVKCVPVEGTKKAEDKEDESLCGLVFVDRGHTAFALNKVIQELCNWDPDLFFVQSSHITGHGTHPSSRNKEADIMYRKQEEILRKFRNKEFNLLVSTSVLEEGVDVPRCNLVVRFDLPSGYRSYVQSKGRARSSKSKFCMLVDSHTTPTFHDDLHIFKGIESILLNRCHNREDLTEEEVDKAVADTLLPVYYTTQLEDCATVRMSTAIALVNKYCAKLPSDAFTHLTPKCKTVRVEGEDGRVRYVSTLQLPINSPIKEPIQGEAMDTKKLAKMAVALKTCIILHTTGELDDRLLPVGKEVIKYEDEEGEWEEHEAQGQARPGTTKRKQYYYKKTAKALLGRPVGGVGCFMYILNMKLTCPITEEQNTRGRKIHAPEDTSRCFGLLSAKRIPLVPQFPVFTRSGEVTVSVDLVDMCRVFTQEELNRLSNFHHIVFSKVLRLEKDPMMFFPEKSESLYIVIPFLKGADEDLTIDWDFVHHVETTPITSRRAQLYEQKKDKFEFVPKLFDDAVVMPSYRNIDQPQYFYVAEIREDLNPRSPFPSPELYDTFEHYYSSKYGLVITNVEQPLLDVDHTSARLNLLTPRYMNQKGVALPTSSAETRRARRENLQQKQILVPELCDVHPFPASLWRKAVCLPAMLYRMNCLLIAEEIRETIAKGAHIGVVYIAPEFRFTQLEFGFSTKPIDAMKLEDVEHQENDSNKDADSDAEISPSGADDKNDKGKMCSDEEISKVKEEKPQSDLNDEAETFQECIDKVETTHCEIIAKGKDEPTQSTVKENEISPQQVCERENKADGKSATKGKDSKEQTVMEKHEEIMQEKKKKERKQKMTVEIEDITDEEDEIRDERCRNKDVESGADEKTWDIDMSALAQDKMMKDLNHIMEFQPLDSMGMTLADLEKEDDLIFGENMGEEEGFADATEPTGVKIVELDDAEAEQLQEEINGEQNQNLGESDSLYLEEEIHIEETEVKTSDADKVLTKSAGGLPVNSAFEELRCSDGGRDSASSFHTAAEFLTPDASPYKCPTASSALNELETGFKKMTLDDEEVLVVTKTETLNDDSKHADEEIDMKIVECEEIGTNERVNCLEDDQQSFGSCSSVVLGVNKKENVLDKKDISACSEDVCHCDIHDSLNPHLADGSLAADLNAKSQSCDIDGAKTTSQNASTYQPNVCESSPGTGEVGELEGGATGTCNCKLGNGKEACTDCSMAKKKKSKSKKKKVKTGEDKEMPKEKDKIDNADLEYAPLVRFDEETNLDTFIGPSPCTILQTLTMSNANDFFNLERLETIGDSFLKFAITVYLYCSYPGIHEGKLSYLRSKQVSNYNLYKLGKKKHFPESMVAAKFEPTENWLPPGFIIKKNNAYKGLSVFIANAMQGTKKDGKDGEESKEENESNKIEQDGKDESHVITNGESDVKSVDSRENEDLKPDNDKTDAGKMCKKDQDVSMRNEKNEKSAEEISKGSKEENEIESVKTTEALENSKPENDMFQNEKYNNETQETDIKVPQNGEKETENRNNENTESHKHTVIKKEPEVEANASENNKANVESEEVVETEEMCVGEDEDGEDTDKLGKQEAKFAQELEQAMEGLAEEEEKAEEEEEMLQCLIPYNLQTQHSLPDKSIADCVEALIGCYLTTCGQRAALQFMSWLGLKVLPESEMQRETRESQSPASPRKSKVAGFGYLEPPPSPLLTHICRAEDVLAHRLDGYEAFEERIKYQFRDRSYLLQAFTHASYHYNSVTDCYQRLEFLGDAILDYVITRHLFEDSKKHSPGILTDLRSALVNNNIFAALAVKWDFHKYFKAVSPQLFNVIEKFVTWQKDKNDEINIDEEFGDFEEEGKAGEGEDIEIPKALGDIFESVAGAIYLDSGMSLDTVWRVYYRMMKPQIDAFTAKIPKSPVRELLEMEPETAKFEKPERTMDGKIRVSVNVVGKGRFRGIGRNYRIAKSAAAKRALKFIRMLQAHIEAGGSLSSLQQNMGQFGDALPIINMDPLGING